jgi:hypothetical protein
MKQKTGKRSKVRKTFNREVSFEIVVVQSDRVENIQQDGVCLDISESGLGLSAGVPLQRSQVVKVFLPVQKVRTSLPVFAEVIWSEPSNGSFRMGLRILQ